MIWPEIREKYPNQWLIVEALEAHSNAEQQRKLDNIIVIESCDDGGAALQAYRRLHHRYPAREFYFLHTSREEPDIRERQWLGIRYSNN